MDFEYCYEPLPTEESFRVLELLPGDEDDDISYILHLADWNHPPAYEALSYTWGDTSVKVPTVCGGRRLEMMPNLQNGLRQLRLKTRSRMIWADAVCINQQDVGERSDQVNKMLWIYRGATRVLVWLGPDEDGYTAIAVQAMKEIIRASSKQEDESVTKRAEPWTDLACNNASSWHSIKWFFSRPWFSRLWVLQEVNSGPEVLVICAGFEIGWHVVKSIAEYIEPSHIWEVYSFWESEMWSALTMMRDYSRRKKDDVRRLEVLHSLRRFHTTDPRDKIYAVLGMKAFQVGDPQAEEEDARYSTSGKPWISADYTKSTVEVYRNFATTLILKEPRNLNPLSYVQSGRGLPNDDFPSWAPRWDQTNNVHTISVCMRTRSLKTNASSGLPVFIQISESNENVLEVSGLQFDIIARCTQVQNELWFHSDIHRMENHPVLGFGREQQSKPTIYPTGDPSILAYAMALTAGMHHLHPSIEDYTKEFEAYLDRLQEVEMQNPDNSNSPLLEGAKTRSWRRWERAARDTCWNRTLFTTSKGYIGIGPKALQVGDLLCVLSGGRVPFVLRRKDDIFQLIGECYVYGIMSGQAVESMEGSRSETVFKIS
jgi:hypothetical protein